MVSTTKILITPSATQAEIDGLPGHPAGSEIFNTDTRLLQITPDGSVFRNVNNDNIIVLDQNIELSTDYVGCNFTTDNNGDWSISLLSGDNLAIGTSFTVSRSNVSDILIKADGSVEIDGVAGTTYKLDNPYQSNTFVKVEENKWQTISSQYFSGTNVTSVDNGDNSYTFNVPSPFTGNITGNAATATTSSNITGGYVISITGTSNQVIASAPQGAITLSLPQSIATSSSPQFANVIVNNNGDISADTSLSANSFNITNNAQGGGENFGIHPNENIVFKTLNLQAGVDIVFPVPGGNDMGSGPNRLANLWVTNINGSAYPPAQNYPQDYVKNLNLGFTSGTVLSISAGYCRDSTNTLDINVASPLSLNIAVSGANGLDTGSPANNTWYYAYVIADSSSVNPVSGLLSVSSSAPTLPGGYNKFRRIGASRRGGGDFIQFKTSGTAQNKTYLYTDDTGLTRALLGGGATVQTPINCAAFIPPTASDDFLAGVRLTPVVASFAYFEDTGNTVTISSTNYRSYAYSAGSQQVLIYTVVADSAKSIDYVLSESGASLNFIVVGFTDNI